MISPQLAACPRVGAAAKQERDRKGRERRGDDPGGHTIGTGAHANGESPDGEQEHRHTQQKADCPPHKLQDAEQMKMCAQT